MAYEASERSMNNQEIKKNLKVVVLGATGYVGGRLVPQLLEAGYQVRAAGRSIEKLKSRYWSSHKNVELASVDVHELDSLKAGLTGADVAYYLVHSMNPQSRDFEYDDRQAADHMVKAARDCGLKRIIYLGGLGEQSDRLSKHLKSRHEVSEILKLGSVPVTVLRAAMIIGSGSASFEILRYLVDRLPVMVTPRWVKTPNQPIAIRNVIEYLCRCLEKDETTGETFDIGGPEVVSYLDLMRMYAEVAGLRKRFVIPVPVLTPRLSSLWIHLVTPVPSYIAQPLAEGLKNPVICWDHRITKIIPQDLLSCREAITRALHSINTNDVKTHWTDAGQIPPCAAVQTGDPHWAGGTIFEDKRVRQVNASAHKTWSVIAQIGGKMGWYHGTWLWVLRGFLDRLLGGVGSSRGRRNSIEIHPGDVLDFWRVVDVEPGRRLLLAAEMKLPGIATLEFRIKESGPDHCEIIVHARFQPRGLSGILYWYALIGLHEYIFGGMIRKIALRAEEIRLKDRQEG